MNFINYKYFIFADVGPYLENSIKSRTSSTPVLLAASISKTSMWFRICYCITVITFLHALSTPFRQFSDFATILAIVVFPTPLIPVNKYAFGILSVFKELIYSLHHLLLDQLISLNVFGRYFNAKTFELFS